MTEGRAIILTGVAHLALFAGLSLTWSLQQSSFPSFEEAVPVEVVEISDVPRITEPPKPSMEAAPQATTEAAAPEPSPVEATAAEPDQPTPQPVSPVPAPEAKPEPRKAETPKADAKPKATKKAERPAEAQELAGLIDKALPKAQRKPIDTSEFAKSIEKALPKGARLDARATATLEQAIRSKIAPCWNPPIGGEDVRSMTVVLRIQLSRQGAVTGMPEVLDQTGVTPGNQAYARAFAESARRAVIRCSPIELPADLYDAWKLFELNFDPSKMT